MRKTLITLYFALFFSICPCLAEHTSYEAVGVLAQQKSECEHWAMVAKTELSKADIFSAEERYVTAKSTFDGWLEQLRLAIRAHKKLTNNELYSQTLSNAAKSCGTFRSFVLQHRPQKASFAFELGPLKIEAGLIDEISKACTDAGLKIWDKAEQLSEQERKDLLDELDRNRFQPWERIPTTVVFDVDELSVQTLVSAARGFSDAGDLNSAGKAYKAAATMHFTSFQAEAESLTKITSEYGAVLKERSPKDYERYMKMNKQLDQLLKSYKADFSKPH